MPRPKKKYVKTSEGSTYWSRFWNKFADELISSTASKLAGRLSTSISDQIYTTAKDIVIWSSPPWLQKYIINGFSFKEFIQKSIEPPPEFEFDIPEPTTRQYRKSKKAGDAFVKRYQRSPEQRAIEAEVEEKLERLEDFVSDDLYGYDNIIDAELVD